MRITKLVVCLSFLLALPILAQHDPRSSISIANQYPVASGGTTVGKLVVLDSTGLAIQTAATSSLSTLGIALTTSSSGAYIFVTQSGPSSCVMDGTSVVNDFITISTSVAGDCHDTGVASSAGTDAVGAGIPVIGVVQQVVTVGNPALIQLSASSVFASGYTLTLAKVNAVVGFSSHNTTLGGGALSTSSTGNSNTAMGFDALASLTTGSSNTGMGYDAGSTLTSGSQNTFLGAAAEPGDITDTNEIVLGYNAGGNGSNTATIGNSSVVHGYIGSNAICLTTGTDCPSGFITNPMTTLGDIIYGGTSGVPTRLAGVTATTTAGSVLMSNGVSSAATAPVWISFQTELNASNLVNGTQPISGCTNGYVLYNNSGKLGCQSFAGLGNPFATGVQVTGPYGSAAATSTGNLDFNSGTTRLVSYGANSSTIGGFNINGGTSTGAITSYMNSQTALTGWVNFPQGGNFQNSANATLPLCVGGGAGACNASVTAPGVGNFAAVGINKTSPQGLLDIATNASVDNAFIMSSLRSNSSNRNWRISLDQNAEGQMDFMASTAQGNYTFSTTALSLTNGGAVLVPSLSSGGVPVCSTTGGQLTSTCSGTALYTAQFYWNLQSALFATGTMLGPVWFAPMATTHASYNFSTRSTGSISCTGAPVINLMDLGTSPATVYGSATSLQTLTVSLSSGGVSNNAGGSINLTAGHYYGVAFSSGTCATAPVIDATLVTQ